MKKIALIPVLLLFVAMISCGAKKGLPASERDGSSIEKAIIVNSIAEEYQYVRRVCQGYDFLGQALVFEDKNPYDILTWQKPDGEKVKYYFDISKFFGKGF